MLTHLFGGALSCCCHDKTEANTQIVLHSLHGLDDDERSHFSDSDGDAYTDRSSTSLSAEDRQREKERLRDLVAGFARSAVDGVPCTSIDPITRCRCAAKYSVEANLANIVLVSEGRDNIAVQPASTRVCRIDRIQDIFSVEDGESCFPPAVLSLLSPVELELLIMITYGSGEGSDSLSQLCFLETSRYRRERFLTCMHVLRLYIRLGERSVDGAALSASGEVLHSSGRRRSNKGDQKLPRLANPSSPSPADGEVPSDSNGRSKAMPAG